MITITSHNLLLYFIKTTLKVLSVQMNDNINWRLSKVKCVNTIVMKTFPGYKLHIQRTLLVGIMDNVINRLIGSNLSPLINPKLFFDTEGRLKLVHSVSYCNQFISVQM